jgi:hypothetical protein
LPAVGGQDRCEKKAGELAVKRAVIATGASAACALLVVLILANAPDAHSLLFVSGARNALYGLAMVALLPLILVVQIGLGAALSKRFATEAALREPWLLWLTGSALLSLLGVAIAAANLVNPWVSGIVLVFGVGYAVATGACSDLFTRILAWIRLERIASGKPAFAFVRLGILFALILISLRAATGELNDTDVVQFYWGWFTEVRHLAGISLSPELPLLDFAPGRGNGVYLLLAGIAPGLVSHVPSAACCIMFAVILRGFFVRIADRSPAPMRFSLRLAADIACLAALWMLPGTVAFGKYHLQLAAWALGFLLTCLHIANEDDATSKAMAVPAASLAVAIPVGLPQFEAFVVLLLVLAAATASLRLRAVRRLFPLLILSGVTAVLSLAANWLYLGIPDYNPFPLFERVIIEPRFTLWTSRLQQYYINYIQGGVLTLKSDDGVGKLRELRSLLGDFKHNFAPILLGAAGIVGVIALSTMPMRQKWRGWLVLPLGIALGYGLYRLSLRITFTDLALAPATNRVLLYVFATCAFVWATRSSGAARPFLLGLIGYWLICAAFSVAFHSGSMDRLIRHSDTVGVAVLLALIAYFACLPSAHSSVSRSGICFRWLKNGQSSVISILVATGCVFSLRAAVPTAAVDPPVHLLMSTLGLQGRAFGLTNPMAKFERCEEIRRSAPADARVLLLNAYTAMAYCNNAVLLPRTMLVLPHASDFARDLATSAFADADTVERTLHEMKIDYFMVLKGDFEFWASGLSAPFRPGELERRFDLLTETPSFYVLTWRGGGRPIPAEALAAITELRRFCIQQSGFMAHNEFVSQWRAMANLGADRPKLRLGSKLDFTASGWSALYADHGWYAADAQGSWTVGPVASLTLPMAQPVIGPLRLTMDVMPFLIPQVPNRTVHVKLAGVEVATWTFQVNDGYQTKQIDLPTGAGTDPRGLALTFEIENSVSQYALGLNPDWRPLGISVRSLAIEDSSQAPR